jgi:hypothetical protein
MSLKPLNLDDRRFQDLLEAAMTRARQSCPEWSDMSPGDPGRVMLELMAYLTEVMIFKLNRLPVKVYIECLRLLGVALQPPSAAVTTLRFSLKEAGARAVEIPRGTRVAAERGEAGEAPPVFVTAEPATIAPGQTTVETRAYHCEWIEAELVGTGTGFPGLVVKVSRPPIVAPTGDGLELIVGLEAKEDELDPNTPVRRFADKAFRVWRVRDNFADLWSDGHVYMVDRLSGVITFAPALRMSTDSGDLAERPQPLAEVPREGREIRVWYRSGGGPAGNVVANRLTKIIDPVPGVTLEVTNPVAATGGRAAETLEHALKRGPQELHSLRRAVTAEDFRVLALRSSGAINRAFAYNKFEMWRYAPRGTVEVICIPHVPPERFGSGPVTPEHLRSSQTDEALEQIQQVLETRKPVGTGVAARWGRCKQLKVKARIVVYHEEDREAVRGRVLQRLYDMITPLDRGPDNPGWSFGQPLSTYDVYRVLSSEPGVKYVDPVRLCLDQVPAANLSALSVDAFQPRTWYAGSGDAVFRSLNDGDGWEQIARIAGGEVKLLQAYPREAAGPISRAGLIAAISEFGEGKSRVHLSRDCGESWEEIGARPQFRIDDIAWMDREGEPVLLLASEKGLYELATHPGAEPVAILVDPKQMDLGFWCVAVSTDVWGQTCVAVGARERRGIFLSQDGGKPQTFQHIGLEDEVRVLTVQHYGPKRYLWAGIEAVGDDPGTGCARWQLPESPEGWRPFGDAWTAGGCRALAFLGSKVLAATRRHGVLSLDPDEQQPRWSAPDVQSGLPLKTFDRMHPVDFVAAAPGSELAPDAPRATMAAGPVGIYRSRERGRYEQCSQQEFSDRVTLPDTWVFCSQEHEIEVVTDATRGD